MVTATVLALAVPSSAEIESATPSSQTITAGDSTTVTVTLDSVGASCLSALTPPPGFTILFAPTCTATAGAWTSVASITTADTTLPGTYVITILETPVSPIDPADAASVTIVVEGQVTTTLPAVTTTLPEVTTTVPEVTTTLPEVTTTTLPADPETPLPSLPTITLPPGETTTTTVPGSTTTTMPGTAATTTTVAGHESTTSTSTTVAGGTTTPSDPTTPTAAGQGPGGSGQVDEIVTAPGPGRAESPLGPGPGSQRVIEGEGNRDHLAGLVPANDPAAASPRPDSLAARLLSSMPELAIGSVTGPLAVLIASLRALLESWILVATPLAVGALSVPRWRTHVVRFTRGRLQALREAA